MDNLAKRFKCNKCGETRFEEVMTDVVVLSEVSHVSECGAVDYAEQMNDDGSVLRYQCLNCGTGIRRPDGNFAYDGESLVEALKAMPEPSDLCHLCVVEGHDVCSLDLDTTCSCCKDTLASMIDGEA